MVFQGKHRSLSSDNLKWVKERLGQISSKAAFYSVGPGAKSGPGDRLHDWEVFVLPVVPPQKLCYFNSQ
jgi:hypothetical protein